MQEQEISIFPEEQIVYATFGQRLGALILDGLVLIVPQSIITSAFGNHSFYLEMFKGNISGEGVASDLLKAVVSLLYFALMESSKSQATVGKMALKLKVTDMNGNRISFQRAVGRHLGKFISAIIILIGYLMVLWDSKRQALHDKMAGTLVVKSNKL